MKRLIFTFLILSIDTAAYGQDFRTWALIHPLTQAIAGSSQAVFSAFYQFTQAHLPYKIYDQRLCPPPDEKTIRENIFAGFERRPEPLNGFDPLRPTNGLGRLHFLFPLKCADGAVGAIKLKTNVTTKGVVVDMINIGIEPPTRDGVTSRLLHLRERMLQAQPAIERERYFYVAILGNPAANFEGVTLLACQTARDFELASLQGIPEIGVESEVWWPADAILERLLRHQCGAKIFQ